jgi:putative ABC transport system permease protein
VSAAPVVRAAWGGLLRGRLVQTVVIFLVLAASTGVALLGLALYTSANEGFNHEFAAEHGAQLAVTIDSAKVTSARLAATRHLPGVTQAAGPYPEATVTLTPSGAPRPPRGRGGRGRPGNGPGAGRRLAGGGGAVPMPALTVVGRVSRSGQLDDITVTAGRWVTRPGEIALAHAPGVPLGSTVTVTSAPGSPRLTVAGFAASPGQEEDAWVLPSQIAALRPRGAPAQVQMLYTFTRAATAAQIYADLEVVKAALPAGAVTGSASWLHSLDETSQGQATNTPFVVAFALIGLVLSALITASVVSAAVAAGYRRIGVLKSIGFTPAQVTAAYLAQPGAPALAGCVAGAALGNWWALPKLNYDASALTATTQTVPLWINVTVPLGMLALTGLAALVPAARAGRLPAVAVITAGQAPRAGHGYAAYRLAGRVALPRPVTIGLAAPFSRPARSAVTLAAITFGLTAVVLAAGLDSSVMKINHNAVHAQGQVQVAVLGGRGSLTAAAIQQRAAGAALRAQPGTLRFAAQAQTGAPGSRPVISVPGLGQVPVTLASADAAWLGQGMFSGRWYQRAGEVDANPVFLTQAGLNVGDTVTMTVNGKPVTARIVGEVFATAPGPALFTSPQTLGAAAAGLAWQYNVGLKPGTSVQAYVHALSRVLGPPGFVVAAAPQSAPSFASMTDLSLSGCS